MAQNSEVELFLTRNFSAVSLDGVQGGNLEFCINVVKEAKSLTPVDKGQLRNSLQYIIGDGTKGGLNDSSGERAESIDATVRNNEAAFGASADYAVYVELGTRRQVPQPYLRPAIALVKGYGMNDVIRKINEEITRGVLRQGQTRETFV